MSRRTLDDTLAFIGAVDRATTPEAISDAILRAAERHGFTHVLAGTIPHPGMSPQQQVANVLLHRWPDAWSQRYFSQGYLFKDPTISRVLSSTEPFTWEELKPKVAAHRGAAMVMGEANEFGLGAGFTVPLITLDGQTAGFSLAGERADLAPEARGGLQLLANYAFARSLAVSKTDTPVRLTTRERDVLTWIAEGKSDWDIAHILHVSEHTIDKIARQIRVKFGATNRTQAVAQAFRQNLLR